ncbi:MAG: hypothetical protein ACKOWF_10485 [Chloroflexota bacterium]
MPISTRSNPAASWVRAKSRTNAGSISDSTVSALAPSISEASLQRIMPMNSMGT